MKSQCSRERLRQRAKCNRISLYRSEIAIRISQKWRRASQLLVILFAFLFSVVRHVAIGDASAKSRQKQWKSKIFSSDFPSWPWNRDVPFRMCPSTRLSNAESVARAHQSKSSNTLRSYHIRRLCLKKRTKRPKLRFRGSFSNSAFKFELELFYKNEAASYR